MIVRLPILSLALALVTVSVHADKKSFERSWKGRVVTLKQPLHSVVYDDLVDGIVIVSEGGRRYESNFILKGDALVDSDPQRIVTKIRARLGTTGGEAMLVTYDAGTKMRVKDVSIARGWKQYNRRVIFWLYGEFKTKGKADTALMVELPQDISAAFTEEPDVERIAQTIFSIE